MAGKFPARIAHVHAKETARLRVKVQGVRRKEFSGCHGFFRISRKGDGMESVGFRGVFDAGVPAKTYAAIPNFPPADHLIAVGTAAVRKGAVHKVGVKQGIAMRAAEGQLVVSPAGVYLLRVRGVKHALASAAHGAVR